MHSLIFIFSLLNSVVFCSINERLYHNIFFYPFIHKQTQYQLSLIHRPLSCVLRSGEHYRQRQARILIESKHSNNNGINISAFSLQHTMERAAKLTDKCFGRIALVFKKIIYVYCRIEVDAAVFQSQ